MPRSRRTVDPLYKAQRAPRTCDICGKPYYRCNTTKQWPTRNPGHRDGWGKSIVTTCVYCTSPQQSQRLLIVAQMTVVKKGKTA